MHSFYSRPTAAYADSPYHTNLTSYQEGDLGKKPTQTFFSSPVKAPIYQVNKLDTDRIDDTRFIFLTGGYGGYGPSIVSSKDLSLVYADHGYNFAQAARPGMLYGKPVLVVYAGDAVRIFNQHYELLYAVQPQGDLKGESYVLFTSNNITALNGAGALTAVSKRKGFETSFHVNERRRFARIAALHFNGTILGYTMAMDTMKNKTIDPGYPIDEVVALKQVDRTHMSGLSVWSYVAVFLVVGLTALLALLIVRSARGGVRCGYAGIAGYKRKTTSLISYFFSTIRQRNNKNDDIHLGGEEEEESLIGERGIKE
ncbi:hypothetical protein F5Y03DRAFT_396128 [Xylaria venustula]|nr:hypothetical protein F5Y03DRAFT_396128 [Xylaria venustula]